MASLFSRVARLAASPQGRQALEKAKQAAADPKNKQKANDLLDKAKAAVNGKKGGGTGTGTGTPPRA